MPGSNVLPESVPVCLLRLSEDDFDLLSRWFCEVMQLAGLQKRNQIGVLSIINNVEKIIRKREEAPTDSLT